MVPWASLDAFLWNPGVRCSEGPSQLGRCLVADQVPEGRTPFSQWGQAGGQPLLQKRLWLRLLRRRPLGTRGKDPLDSEGTCSLQTAVLKSKFFIAAQFLKF